MQKLLVALALMAVTLAGCTESDDPAPTVDTIPQDVPRDLTNVTAAAQLARELNLTPIMLEESLVDVPTIDQLHDPYEPTMDVCDDGSIYVTGHTFLVDTTGAPVWGSHDDGATWEQLPWFMDQQMPAGVPGATPPVTDEIFLACGDDGYLYGSDITLATYPVNAWSDHGQMHDYWNFNGYDETKAVTQAGECNTLGVAPVPAPAKDRPWAAYNGGTLLLTSNPAGGANQIGVVDAPFGNPSPWSLGHVVDGIEWNLCAGPGGSIPGVPDISKEGLIAAPQRAQGGLVLSLADKSDIMSVQNVKLFDMTTIGEITSVYGHATFDADSNLFVGITNNTREQYECEQEDIFGQTSTGTCTRALNGGMKFALSIDGGETFTVVNYTSEQPLVHFYMDANRFGPGALVTWAVRNETTGFDWYMGHLLQDNGTPYLSNVFEVISQGTQPSAHVTGAAVGPDGRAYTAMYNRGTTQLSVFIQRDGPTMPIYAPVEVAAAQM